MELLVIFPAKGRPIGPMGLHIADPWAPLHVILKGPREELQASPYNVRFRGFLNPSGAALVVIPVTPGVIDALRREEAAAAYLLDILEHTYTTLTSVSTNPTNPTQGGNK